MAKYRVEFEFKVVDYEVSDGKWHKDFLDNNGKGFTFEDAEKLAGDLRYNEFVHHRNVDVVEIESNDDEVEYDNSIFYGSVEDAGAFGGGKY